MPRATLVLLCIAIATGCSTRHYLTPGAGVDLASIDDARTRPAIESIPAAAFPATIALVRVQASGYRSYSNSSFGRGPLGVVTTRDAESPEDLFALDNLPRVSAVVPLNRFLLPPWVQSRSDLRAAAAMLRADMLLAYSIDTSFHVGGKDIGPLSALPLGAAPKDGVYVTTTATAALLDARTGFVYGLAEGTARDDKVAYRSSETASVEQARLSNEAAAFSALVGRIAELWDGILAEHDTTRRAAN